MNTLPLRGTRALAFVAGLWICGLAMAAEPAASLRAQAKIDRKAAEKIALAAVPDGRVKSFELEREDGKLVWSFDITLPKSKDIKEVQVDAASGEIVSAKLETPAEQAKEAKMDKLKGKPKTP